MDQLQLRDKMEVQRVAQMETNHNALINKNQSVMMVLFHNKNHNNNGLHKVETKANLKVK